MNNNLKFRNLDSSELSVRISEISGAGVNVIIHTDARAVLHLLDEKVGNLRYHINHGTPNYGVNEWGKSEVSMPCTISIFDDVTGQWVEKSDFGIGSDVKSAASDGIKRAACAWGIGRALYTMDDIILPLEFVNTRLFKNRVYCDDELEVTGIRYDELDRVQAIQLTNTNKKDAVTTISFQQSKVALKTPLSDTNAKLPVNNFTESVPGVAKATVTRRKKKEVKPEEPIAKEKEPSQEETPAPMAEPDPVVMENITIEEDTTEPKQMELSDADESYEAEGEAADGRDYPYNFPVDVDERYSRAGYTLGDLSAREVGYVYSHKSATPELKAACLELAKIDTAVRADFISRKIPV